MAREIRENGLPVKHLGNPWAPPRSVRALERRCYHTACTHEMSYDEWCWEVSRLVCALRVAPEIALHAEMRGAREPDMEMMIARARRYARSVEERIQENWLHVPERVRGLYATLVITTDRLEALML